MSSSKGVNVLLEWTIILAATLVLLVPSTAAQSCPDIFTSTSGAPGGFGNVVEVEDTLDETAQVGTEMYTLSWEADCVEPPLITDGSFNKYFTVNDTQNCAWTVSVKKSLVGVPDYPNNTEEAAISTTAVFKGFATISGGECSVTLVHKIRDKNTQKPEPDKDSYTLNIAEDLSVGYTIADFNMSVHDKDGSSPNNQFSVTVSEDCPLEATRQEYTSGLNPRQVEYKLRETVDFETNQTIICTVTFVDKGSPPLADSATVTITVLDINDEPPVFTHSYYYSELSSVEEDDNPLDIYPSVIQASDGDTGLNEPITYTMTNANPNVSGTDYFTINKTTGEVTLVKDLDNEFLFNERALFFVKASDGKLTSSSVLDVILPPVPTTTPTTTTTTPASTTTCEPCTCPTYTTEITTEPSTTEDTCTPCPSPDTTTELVCPTTPTEGTCTPCPSETTMACTCPEITCPTTPTEGTCTPCPTETTTACPVITCPTTPPECTCPTETTNACPVITCPTTPPECTCPTETTTACPVITCPTTPTECPTTTTATHPTVTWDPALPPITFKKESYVADIYSSHTTLFEVEVEDIEGYEVTFSLRGEGSQHFTIDSKTGIISVKESNQPPVGLYEFEAVANIVGVTSEEATTKVTIHVLPMSLDEVAIYSSVIRASTPEGDGVQELSSVTLSDEAKIVCVTGAEPKNLKDRFTVVQKSEREWTLKKSGVLDYEEAKEVTLYLKAYTSEAPDDCSSIDLDIPSTILKSEALAIITVINTNDEAPAFSSDNVVAAYPINEALQRAAGPVVSVQAHDNDTTDITYSLAGENAAKFTVDEVTGEVYAVEGTTCDPQCTFVVKASDGRSEDQVNVKVLPLDTSHVFTIPMPNTALSEVDGKLEDLSEETEAQISVLYVSPTETTSRRGRARYRRDTTMNLLVHVYSIQKGALMSRDELNSALSDTSSELQAEEFIDADVFEGVEPEDTTGLKVAVGVLGGLLGIVLIAGTGFFVYQRKKGKAAPMKERVPTPISTLGQAYHNDAYVPDAGRSQVNLGSGSLGHKSNGSLNGYPGGGSLNGYTNAEVHRHQDSPPLHRSPLAPPTDTIPLRTRDSQQQGGLKRTDAGAPEYYGSSSPNPPPSFSSTSPSYPIYAELKKPKKSSSTEYKSQHVSDDEDEPIDNKFSSARHSPPPRRSNKQDSDEDDDVGGDVAYPGGKHGDFKEEPAEEEKKSVAFKVKVETKEIEAENMGPAQKKAEVAKIMEANRKKIEEEGGDEDEEEKEEESMKL